MRILRWPYAENDRAQAERKTGGHIKLVTSRKGEILGVCIVGAGASEMIGMLGAGDGAKAQPAGHGIDRGALPDDGRNWQTRRDHLFCPQTRKPLVRALVRFLRLFG